MSIIQTDRNKSNPRSAVVTAPTVEPITVDEVKLFARIDGTEEDSLLSSFITSARMNCETYLRRSLLRQEIQMTLDYWPGPAIELMRSPVISIASIYSYFSDGSSSLYASSNYYLSQEEIPNRLVVTPGMSYPDTSDLHVAGYKIRYYAGYGTEASDVPSPIRDALKLWVTSMYENRVIRTDPPPEVLSILQSYRVIRIG